MITLKTLPQATAQQVFDQVATHLLSQKEKSIDDSICLYRYGQLKCAAGCLIDDDEYDPKMEKASWMSLVVEDRVPHKHSRLIIDLQMLHDAALIEDWKEELIKVANKHRLNTKVIDENVDM